MNAWDLALNALQVASILAAAGFAAFGLFSKYRDDDGKITRAGKVAVGGIALAAILSLTTQAVKAESDRRKAEKATAERNGELTAEILRYQHQSGQLRDIEGLQRIALNDTKALQDQARDTLTNLQSLQRQAALSLLTTRQVGEQERRNTAAVLQTMWVDANRVRGATTSLLLAVTCSEEHQYLLPLLPHDAVAGVRVFPTSSRAARDWHGRIMEITAGFSFDQRITLPRGALPGIPYSQITRFEPFIFENDLDDEESGLFDPRNWRDLAVEIEIKGTQPELLDSLENYPRLSSRDSVEYHSSGAETGLQPFDARRIPCSARAALFVVGREIVGSEEGAIVVVRDHPLDRRGRVVVRFPKTPVDDSELPTLSARGRLATR